jgi:hypothetical protein
LDLDGLGSELESRQTELMGESDEPSDRDEDTLPIAPEPDDSGRRSNRSEGR